MEIRKDIQQDDFFIATSVSSNKFYLQVLHVIVNVQGIAPAVAHATL